MLLVDVERLAEVLGWVEDRGEEAEPNKFQICFEQVRLQFELIKWTRLFFLCLIHLRLFLLLFFYRCCSILHSAFRRAWLAWSPLAALSILRFLFRLNQGLLFVTEDLFVRFPGLWLEDKEATRDQLFVHFQEKRLDADITKGKVDPLNGR